MLHNKGIIIIGAGGHGKVVLSTLIALGKKIAGFVDDNPSLLNHEILGYKVLGNTTLLANRLEQTAIFGIGNNKLRKKISSIYPYLVWEIAIHPRAYVHESVLIGEGTVVFAGAVIQPDTIVGKHVIINTASSIDHDCHIKDFSHIAPKVGLAGHVKINEGCFLGIGCSIIPSIHIGQWTNIAAGSTVVSHMNDHVCAKGVPAREYKKEKILIDGY